MDFSDKKVKVKNLTTNEVSEESYDKLMIASGARAIIPPIKNIDLENVVTLKSMDDGDKLRELMAKDEYKKVILKNYLHLVQRKKMKSRMQLC